MEFILNSLDELGGIDAAAAVRVTSHGDIGVQELSVIIVAEAGDLPVDDAGLDLRISHSACVIWINFREQFEEFLFRRDDQFTGHVLVLLLDTHHLQQVWDFASLDLAVALLIKGKECLPALLLDFLCELTDVLDLSLLFAFVLAV